jgi:signal transduction histidine kinase
MSSSQIIDPNLRELAQLRHDMRQYVTAGALLAELPGDDSLEPELRGRLQRLRDLFTQMRELTASTAPPVQRNGRATAVVDLVTIVDESVSFTRLRRDVPLELSTEGPVLAGIDAVMVRRALINVLDNATRAAGETGQVWVALRSAHDVAVVEVIDDGPGFGRIPSVSGHGMAIVDQAMRACHGRLEIVSGPGPGTTVRMLIPVLTEGGRLS